MSVKRASNLGIVVGLLMLIYPTVTFSQEIDRGVYQPTIFPDVTAQLWTDIYPTSHSHSLMYINQNDSQLDSHDALYIDTYSNVADAYTFYRSITADNDTDTITVEAKVRLDAYAGTNDWGGCLVAVENDVTGEQLFILENKIKLWNANAEYFMDTTDNYHTYRMVIANNNIRLYVDGNATPSIDKTLPALTWAGRNIVAFGDGTSISSSKSSWAYVEYTVDR